MILLASFTYHEPSLGTVLAGGIVGLVILALLGLSRSILLGSFGGAFAGAAIAWVVAGMGSGDMIGLMQEARAIFFGVIGLIAGAIAGLIGKSLRKSTVRREARDNPEKGHAGFAKPPDPLKPDDQRGGLTSR